MSDAASTKSSITPKRIMMVIAGVLLILFFVLNLQQVRVHLLIATVTMPLIIALAISAALSVLITWAITRHRAT